jgi:hypothetical protein
VAPRKPAIAETPVGESRGLGTRDPSEKKEPSSAFFVSVCKIPTILKLRFRKMRSIFGRRFVKNLNVLNGCLVKILNIIQKALKATKISISASNEATKISISH